MYGIILDASFEQGYLILIDLVKKNIIYKKEFFFNTIIEEFDIMYKNFLIDDNVQFIAVGIGPGSFTGIRNSLCVAYSLCFVLKTPLISFCSLNAYMPKNRRDNDFYSAYSINTNTIALLKCFFNKKKLIMQFEEKPVFFKNNFSEIKEDVFSPQANLLKTKGLKKVFSCQINAQYLCSVMIDKYKKNDFVSIKKLIPFYY